MTIQDWYQADVAGRRWRSVLSRQKVPWDAVPDETVLPTVGVVASSEDGDNVAANVLDGDFATRWSAAGWGETLDVDLGAEYPVGAVLLAFFQGDSRTALFDLYTSLNGEDWTAAFLGGYSSGLHLGFDQFDIVNTTARFVRVWGRMNSSNEWNSITQMEVLSHTGLGNDGLAPTFLASDVSALPGLNVVSWSATSQTGGTLERAFDTEGPWAAIDQLEFVRQPEDGREDYALLDGRMYWYRVTLTNSTGQAQRIIGPVTADVPDEPTTLSHGFYLTASMTGLSGAGKSVSGLTASSMSATTSNGQVIENLDIQRSPGISQTVLRVQHNNVTIRYCRIGHPGGANGIEIVNGVTGTTIEYCDFDGMFPNYNGNFGSNSIIARNHNDTSITRCHFIGNRDMTHVYNGDSFYFAENFQSQLAFNSGQTTAFHCDGGLMVRGSSNIVSEKNQFRSYIAGSGSAIYADQSVVHEYDMRLNHIRSQLNSAGEPRGYGCYGGNTGHSFNSQNTGVRINGNWFTPPWQYPGTTGRGTNAAVNVSKPGHTFNDNYMMQLVDGKWVIEATPLLPQSTV